MPDEHCYQPGMERFNARVSPQMVERVHRFPILPELKRDLARRCRCKAERRPGPHILPHIDIERPETRHEADPPICMLDNHDPTESPIRAGKRNPARARGDDLRAWARRQHNPRLPLSAGRRLAETGRDLARDRQLVLRGRFSGAWPWRRGRRNARHPWIGGPRQ